METPNIFSGFSFRFIKHGRHTPTWGQQWKTLAGGYRSRAAKVVGHQRRLQLLKIVLLKERHSLSEADLHDIVSQSGQWGGGQVVRSQTFLIRMVPYVCGEFSCHSPKEFCNRNHRFLQTSVRGENSGDSKQPQNDFGGGVVQLQQTASVIYLIILFRGVLGVTLFHNSWWPPLLHTT